MIGATIDSACGAGEDIVTGTTVGSACGADPDVPPSGLKSYEVESGDECIDDFGYQPIPVQNGLKSYEMGDILHCSDIATTPIVSQRGFRSRFNRKSLGSGSQGCGNEPVVRDPTKLTTPLRWKVEDQSGIRPVPQAPIVGTIVSKSIVSKK